MVGTGKLSGAGVTDSSAIRRTLHNHGLPNTSAVGLVEIEFVTVLNDSTSLLYFYSFQRGEESETPSTLGNKRPSAYYA